MAKISAKTMSVGSTRGHFADKGSNRSEQKGQSCRSFGHEGYKMPGY
jgi:hypothetical protein